MIHCTCNFYSQALKYRTDINVLLPDPLHPPLGSGREKSERLPGLNYPVLLLLHGGADDCHSWMRQTNIEQYANDANLAVVMPSGHNSFYCDAVYGEHFFTYLTQELLPFVRSIFPLSGRREDTFIAGASMGGYGSALVALKKPCLVSEIGIFSGAIDPHRINVRLAEIGIQDVRFDLIFGGSDQIEGSDFDLFKAISSFGIEAEKFNAHIYCAAEDLINYDMSEELHHGLVNAGFESRFTVGEGGHTWEFWDFCARNFITDLLERGVL